jgi:LPS-assembly lipoprotein
MNGRAIRRWSGVAGALAATALVGGCGFHLQGRVALPRTLATTHIDVADKDNQSDFVLGLRQALAGAGATLVAEEKQAAAVIHVAEDRLDERVLSVSARNVPREYELIYTVRLSVSAGGKEILAPEELSATRDFSFDESQVLAKEREQAVLRAALARDIVALVMRRLATL